MAFGWVVAGFHLDTEEGLNYLPGFVEAILGLQRGETRTFDLVFPQTWQVETTRGATGHFVVSYIVHYYFLCVNISVSVCMHINIECIYPSRNMHTCIN